MPRPSVARRGAPVALLWMLAGCGPVAGPADGPGVRTGPPEPAPLGRLRVLDAYLVERLAALEAASARFRAGMELLRYGDFPVLIGTPRQIDAVLRPLGILVPPLEETPVGDMLIAEVVGSREIHALLVRIDLDRLRLFHLVWVGVNQPHLRNVRMQQQRFDRLVEATLIHEVWGHLLPVAEARSAAGTCPDPLPGELAGDSCVMRRENDLRAELGWQPRPDYPLALDSDPVARARRGERRPPRPAGAALVGTPER